MTGKVIPFPGCPVPPHDPPMPHLPTVFSPAWQAENLRLVDQAITLLNTSETELQRRCQTMAGQGGRTFLANLTAQIDDLSSIIGDVAIALSLAAMRIRRTMKELPA